MRVLSGIQPTGRPHWGNYFGAIQQYIDLQRDHVGYYFVANLHALTTIRDAELLRQLTRDAALDLLALGLDPARATLFVQSDVPEVTQLTWILMTCTPLGLLERCHAYKEKKARGLTADAGLFTYPVLMSADILAYDANWVPVGQDQVQHIEVCRDLATSFNHHFGEAFVLPEARILSTAAKVPGTDGEKMSKSYDNTIGIFEDPKAVRKKIMRMPTDSRAMEQSKDPDSDHLFQLFQLFGSPSEVQEMADLYRTGGFGYGQIKQALADAAERYFEPARQRRTELEQRPDTVEDILRAGAAQARQQAAQVLDRVEQACGIRRAPPVTGV